MITVGKAFDAHREAVVLDARQHPEDPKVPMYLKFLEEAQLFDFSGLKNELITISDMKFEDLDDSLSVELPASYFPSGLPFSSNFVLTEDSKKHYKSVLVEEWQPDLLAGGVFIDGVMIAFSLFLEDAAPLTKHTCTISYNVPHFSFFRRNADLKKFAEDLTRDILFVFSVFEKLTEYYFAQVVDGGSKPFYIKPSKTAKAHQVAGKPIFIFLSQKKYKTQRELDDVASRYPRYKIMHSFPVRGHWRRLQDPRKCGKDRQGNYNQLGFTWVKECIKGAGELIKRPYVVLPGGKTEK